MFKLLSFLLSISFFQCAFSQQKFEPTTLEFQQLTDGLSQNHITDIFQDHQGYIWIATFNGGVNRYNGLGFEVYSHNPQDSSSIPSNSVTQIFEDSNQELWIVTYNGLARFDREKNHFEVWQNNNVNPNLFSSNKIWEVQENEGMFWAATNNGITKFEIENGESEIFGNKESEVQFSDNNISDIATDRKGRIWLGTENGVNIFYANEKKVVLPEQDNGFDINRGVIREVYIDSEEQIWIGKQDGLYLLNEIEENIFEVEIFRNNKSDSTSLGSGRVMAINEDSKGNLWIATENSGLNLFNPVERNFYHYLYDPSNPTSIKSNSIWAIFEDNAERFWLGTFNQGVNVYDPFFRKFHHKKRNVNQPDGLNHNAVSSFLQIGENKFWIGTDGGGITEWNKEIETYRYFVNKSGKHNGLSSNAVLDMHQGKDKSIWIATWEGGLNRYNLQDDTFQYYLFSDDLESGDNVISIDEDTEGNIWVGVFNEGIKKIDTKTGEVTLLPCSELNSCLVREVMLDTKGDLWVTLENEGVNRVRFNQDGSYEVDTFLYDAKNEKSLSSNTTRFIYQDTKERIWIGTAFGLNLYLPNNKGFHHFTKKDGLPNNMINGVVEDSFGNYWVSTNQGISKMTEIKDDIFYFRNYHKGDGLQGDEFSRKACFMDNKGWIYMGGTNGFNYFDPSQVRDNPNIPQVHLTNLKLFNKEVIVGVEDSPLSKDINLTNELILNHKQSVFTIGFTALNLTHANKNQYAYKLEGFDDDWNYVGNQTSATYTNLNAGKYLFRVKASNNDGVWNEDGTSIKITILPPWWETWWAQMIFYSSLLVLGIGIIRTRISIIEKQKKLLEKEVKLRTKEINDQKQEIEEQAKNLKVLNQQKNRLFSIIAHDLRSPLHSLLGITSLLGPDLLKEDDFSKAKEEISSRINGIRGTMENLLYWAGEQMEGEKINKDFVNINRVFEEVIALYSERAKNKELTLINEISRNKYVLADKDLVRIIIRNLVGNAMKFTPRGGIISMGLKEEKACKSVFYVKDNGLGIEPDKIATLFESSVNKSTVGTSGEKGVGLGLLLIKEYIDKNEGDIWVESEINKGSTFFFELPNATNENAKDTFI